MKIYDAKTAPNPQRPEPSRPNKNLWYGRENPTAR